MLPEAAYDLILQLTFVRAAAHVLRGAPAEWSHVQTAPSTQPSRPAVHPAMP
jgi:hypothetical protein